MAQNITNALFTASFTRPANTTAYTAEDAVNDNTSTPHIMSFSSSEVTMMAGQDIIIKSLKVTTDNATVTNGSFRLYLCKSSQTITADNTPQTLLYANRANRIGYIDFTLATGGSGSDCGEAVITGETIPFKLTSGSFYGYLVAKAAYTPASGQNFNLEVEAHIVNG